MTTWLVGANLRSKGRIEICSQIGAEEGDRDARPIEKVRSQAEPDTAWKALYRVGGLAALFGVAIIPIQLVVFIAWPPPDTALGWFTLFQDNGLAGLLAFELLLVVSTTLGIATRESPYPLGGSANSATSGSTSRSKSA